MTTSSIQPTYRQRHNNQPQASRPASAARAGAASFAPSISESIGTYWQGEASYLAPEPGQMAVSRRIVADAWTTGDDM